MVLRYVLPARYMRVLFVVSRVSSQKLKILACEVCTSVLQRRIVRSRGKVDSSREAGILTRLNWTWDG